MWGEEIVYRIAANFKKWTMASLSTFLFIVAGIFGCDGGNEETWENLDLSSVSAVNWMSHVPGWKHLSEFTIPGTHNSGTYNYKGICKKQAGCQDCNIALQLEYGVRFLSGKIGIDKGEPYIWHGNICKSANVSFYELLLSVRDFLLENEREAVIICFLPDGPTDSAKVAEQIEKVLNYEDFKGMIWDADYIPTLDEVRGKIIYWRRYKEGSGKGLYIDMTTLGTDTSYLDYRSTLFYEDLWKCPLRKSHKKYEQVSSHLALAGEKGGAAPDGRFNFFITWTNAVASVLPKPIAWAEQMNKWLIPKLKGYAGDAPVNLGLIAVDFVDEDLARAIFELNFPQMER